jgi:hypothetical protein
MLTMNRFLATAVLVVASQLAVAASPMTEGEVK